jgi:PAS domain S-box-containing protein
MPLISSPLKYVISFFIVAAAAGLQTLLWPYLSPAQFILFYPAVVLAALYGDGLAAIALSALMAQYLFIPPVHSFRITSVEDGVRQVIFVLSALMIHQITVSLSRALAEARVQSEKAKEAETRLAITLSSIGDAVISTDRRGRIIYMNSVAESLTECTLATTQGKALGEVFCIINSNSREQLVDTARNKVLVGRKGKETPIEDSVAAIRSEGEQDGQGVVVVFRDISEKLLQEQLKTENLLRLEAKEARMRSVLDSALDAVVSMDEQGNISQWNPQAERIFGFTRAEAIGRRMSETIVPERFRVAHETGMRHYFASGEGPVLNRRIEIFAVTKDGREFPVELTITPIRTSATVFFYAFLRDISDRKAAESERARLMNELEEAVKVRDDFISIASHELKTPITSLRLQFQLAARQVEKQDASVYSPEMVNKRVESVNRQLTRMSKLIDEMLDASRVNAGKLDLDIESSSLSELILLVSEEFKERFIISNCPFEVQVTPALIVDFDRYRIEQVFSNLLTNAIKYGERSAVSVTLERSNGRALVRVQDQGPGIEPASLDRIFQRFERAVTGSKVSGLGLGLYISRQIVEAHHGKIWAESVVGKGTTFIVELPLKQG